jgi:hypothetical protein
MMNTQRAWLLLFLLPLLITACDENGPSDCTVPEISDQTIFVLPVGDSRVEGDDAPNGFESYRYYLWWQLQENNWDVDFVGSRRSGKEYPPLQDTCFDRDHEGLGGEVTAGALATLEQNTYDPAPDVVLVGIGGNDLLDLELSPQAVLSNIEQIVDELQSTYPGVIIFLEQIAPVRSDITTNQISQAITEFQKGIGALASQLDTPENPVIAIDMYSNWTDSYMADEVHYNEAGAREVGGRYFAAIMAELQP